MEDSRQATRRPDRSSVDQDVLDERIYVRDSDVAQLVNSANLHFKAYKNCGNLDNLELALSYINTVDLEATQGDSSMITQFNLMADILEEIYDIRGEVTDLDKAIKFRTHVVSLIPQGRLDLPAWLIGLGFSHDKRFRRLAKLLDLDKAIDCLDQAMLLIPESDQGRPTLAMFLGTLFESRFKRLDDIEDMNRAIEHMKRVASVTLQDHSLIIICLNALANLLNTRSKRLTRPVDLDEAIQYQRLAISLVPQGHSDMPALLNNLGSYLERRSKSQEGLSDLNQAIEYQSQAISLAPQSSPSMPTFLANLGDSLENRFHRTGDLSDLNQAIAHNKLAISLSPQGPADIPKWLSNLGSSLDSRFRRLGDLEDLNQAIESRRQAVLLTPQGHSELPIRLNNLSYSLDGRFRHLGELSDLDKAMEYMILSVSLTPDGDAAMIRRVSNIGSLFEMRFQRLHEMVDLGKAITYKHKAIQLTPQGHADTPFLLNNLGSSWLLMFQQAKILEDLDRAISNIGRAILLLPKGHSEEPTFLNNISLCLEHRFQHLGDLEDLDKAIKFISQAVSLTPQGHLSMPVLLTNLGASFQARFQRLREAADVDKAIEYYSQAVFLTPQEHSDMPIRLNNLAYAYSARSELPEMANDIDRSLDCFQKAANCPAGNPFNKFQPSLDWARMCNKHRPSLTLYAYQQAMSLLPRIAWLGAPVDSRYNRIIGMGHVATEAAAVAIRMKHYTLALEWLNEGRSIVWQQMLQLRSPIDDLDVVSPILASELRQVARDLENASAPSGVRNPFPPDELSMSQAAQQQHRLLAEKWENLIDEVRRLPGFKAFLRPLEATELIRSALTGPVVLINLDRTSCDALIIQPNTTDILHVPLDIPYENIANARIQLGQLVRSRGLTARKPNITKREGKGKGKESFETILAMLWAQIVKPVLKSLGYMAPPLNGQLPHVTWCTTGPLSFLPLHAAGDYDKEEMTFNYVISSYTPTLSALLSNSPSGGFTGLLAVGQSSALGLPRLPGTVEELNRIEVKSQGHLLTRLDEDLATPPAVLEGMIDHSWVHLACHASQDTKNPLQSAFYLHGGKLDLAAITQKRLKHAELAFLSACQTAAGDEKLSEEAVHLAAGMLMVGYRAVIATMWSIGDEDAPLIAEEVYRHLFEGDKPDARRAAVAVHKAAGRLREIVGIKAFVKWVPYIHIGL